MEKSFKKVLTKANLCGIIIGRSQKERVKVRPSGSTTDLEN